MNKTHWNSVLADGSVPDDLIYEMIDHSYKLVIRGLTKDARAELERQK